MKSKSAGPPIPGSMFMGPLTCIVFILLLKFEYINSPIAWTLFVKKSFDTRSRSNPSSNLGYDTTSGSWGDLGRHPHPGRATTQVAKMSLKTLRHWIHESSLLKCSTSIFLSDVEHITHTYTQHILLIVRVQYKIT